MIVRRGDIAPEVRENMRGGEGRARLTKAFPQLPAHHRLFSIIELHTGDSIGYHVHENETELFYFMQGTARVEDDGDIYTVSAGDSMSTPSGHGHSVMCTSNEPLLIAAVIVKD